MVSSPAHPRPRLARVTPTWVTLSSRPGFASRPNAARAATLPCSANCVKRDRRTDTRATSAAAKKPFNVTIAISRISRNDMDVSLQSSSVVLDAAAPGDQSEHSRFADSRRLGGILVRLAAAGANFRRNLRAHFGEGDDFTRRAGSAAYPGRVVGGRDFPARFRYRAGSYVADGRAAQAGGGGIGGGDRENGARSGSGCPPATARADRGGIRTVDVAGRPGRVRGLCARREFLSGDASRAIAGGVRAAQLRSAALAHPRHDSRRLADVSHA